MEPIPNFDVYAELEVSCSALTETIDAAWRSLMKRNHPDVARSASAHEKTRRLNIAHDWLGDPARRARYDAQRPDPRLAGAYTSQPARPSPRPTPASGPYRQSPEDLYPRTRRSAAPPRPSRTAADYTGAPLGPGPARVNIVKCPVCGRNARRRHRNGLATFEHRGSLRSDGSLKAGSDACVSGSGSRLDGASPRPGPVVLDRRVRPASGPNAATIASRVIAGVVVVLAAWMILGRGA